MSYPGFPHVQYGQYGERTLQYHWAGQSWSHVSHCWYPTLWQPPAERRHITQMLLLVSEWVCESKRVSMWECVCVCEWVSLTAVATRMGQRPERNCCSASSLSLWERSPWILVQAYPSRYRKSSRASAPFLVSTNTSVRESLPGRGTHGNKNIFND